MSRFTWRVSVEHERADSRRSYTCRAFACWTAAMIVLRTAFGKDPTLKMQRRVVLTVERVEEN